ncbi:HK97-gp10 family putative phage morphogenesis protein [Actinomyces faecalis]|uniref:HK97-gp10 family putative phage morphogenesis protein n=1 Tax=Actinomyces faecalis TaxID=2722820 RepID=UPI001554405A|nr:HK97-gp10 family putative phage morphogenesis protein [Actinomyces faecalis]
MKIPNAVLDELTAAGTRLDDHAEAALKAGASVVEPVMRANLASSITGQYSTGQLVAALGVTPVKTDRAGNHNVKVGFDEPRQDGGSNAKIATILEYGSTRQPARPFLTRTRRTTRTPALEAMKRVLAERLPKGHT